MAHAFVCYCCSACMTRVSAAPRALAVAGLCCSGKASVDDMRLSLVLRAQVYIWCAARFLSERTAVALEEEHMS